MCLLNSSEDFIPNIQQPSWFLFGQNNTLTLTGEIAGSATEQFPMPKELRVTTPASFIIHSNTDFTLDITGVDDYPLPITTGGNPQDEKALFYFELASISMNFLPLRIKRFTFPLI